MKTVQKQEDVMVDPATMMLEGGEFMYLLLLMAPLQLAGVAVQAVLVTRINIMPLLWTGIVCTLLTGVLGSVMGVIIAFNAIAKASVEVRQAMMANGISVALFTTAGSLMVAIPGAFFTGVVHSVVATMRDRTPDAPSADAS